MNNTKVHSHTYTHLATMVNWQVFPKQGIQLGIQVRLLALVQFY